MARIFAGSTTVGQGLHYSNVLLAERSTTPRLMVDDMINDDFMNDDSNNPLSNLLCVKGQRFSSAKASDPSLLLTVNLHRHLMKIKLFLRTTPDMLAKFLKIASDIIYSLYLI